MTGSDGTSCATVRFVDANVLLYGISMDPHERAKAVRANKILADRNLGLSVQGLQELHVQATRDSRPDALTHGQATKLVELFLHFCVRHTTTELVLAAIGTMPE